MTTTYQATKVSNLIRCVETGILYYRQRITNNGKSRQMWKSLRTKDFEQAKAVMADTMKESRDRAKADAFKPATLYYTVGDAINALRAAQWTVDGREEAVKPRTLAYYEERCSALLNYWPTLHGTPLDKLTKAEVKQWAAKYAEEYSPQAYNTALSIIRNAYRLAIANKSCSENPTDGVKRRRPKAEACPQLPSSAEFEDMLRVMDCAVWRDAKAVANLAKLLAFSGVRIREAAGLRWQDVDFDNSVLHVRWQRDANGNLVTPKNGTGRDIHMSADLRDTLLAMFNAAERKGPDDRVTTVDSCQHSLDHAARVVGCRRLRQHDLRHLFATRNLECGSDFKTLATWMGHSDGGILAAKLYSHVRADHAKRVAAQTTWKTQEPENITEMRKAI